jgi:hypothetical protein
MEFVRRDLEELKIYAAEIAAGYPIPERKWGHLERVVSTGSWWTAWSYARRIGFSTRRDAELAIERVPRIAAAKAARAAKKAEKRRALIEEQHRVQELRVEYDRLKADDQNTAALEYFFEGMKASERHLAATRELGISPAAYHKRCARGRLFLEAHGASQELLKFLRGRAL